MTEHMNDIQEYSANIALLNNSFLAKNQFEMEYLAHKLLTNFTGGVKDVNKLFDIIGIKNNKYDITQHYPTKGIQIRLVQSVQLSSHSGLDFMNLMLISEYDYNIDKILSDPLIERVSEDTMLHDVGGMLCREYADISKRERSEQAKNYGEKLEIKLYQKRLDRHRFIKMCVVKMGKDIWLMECV